MSRIRSSKALPILSIVFAGISLILFLVKVVLNTAFLSVLNSNANTLSLLASESLKAFLLAFPAVFIILYAALQLKKSDAAKKMFSVLLAAQTLSAFILAARMAFALPKITGKYLILRTGVFAALFALMGICCLIAFFGSLKQKKHKVLVILAASCGIIVALIFAAWEVFVVVHYIGYYGQHIFLLISKIAIGVLYALAIIFYDVAFIFTPLYRETNNQKIRIKLAAKPNLDE